MERISNTAKNAMKAFSEFLANNGIVATAKGVETLQEHLKGWISTGQVIIDDLTEDIQRLKWDENLESAFADLLYGTLRLHPDSESDAEIADINEIIEAAIKEKRANGSSDVESESVSEGMYYFQDIQRQPAITWDESRELSKVYQAGKAASEMLKEYGPTLTQDEIDELKKTISKGNRALNNLIVGNLRLPIAIARKYAGRGVDLMDLIQEGNDGLMKAAERYDPLRPTGFGTYASYWIAKIIKYAIMKNSAIVLPQGIYEDFAKVNRATNGYQGERGKDPTPEDIAKATGLSAKRVQSIIATKDRTEVVSINSTTGGDSDRDTSSLEAIIEDKSAQDGFSQVENESLADELTLAMRKVLTPLEMKVLLLRHGVEDDVERRLEAIGAELGYTKERIRQIEEKATRKMHDYHDAQVLRRSL